MASYTLTHTGQEIDSAVEKVINGYKDVSSVTATAEDVLSGKEIVNSNGTLVSGTMTNVGTVNKTISSKSEVYTIPSGKHSGSGTVQISTAEQNKIIAGNIKKGVTILGVTGTCETGTTTSGIDTSDATATADDIIYEKTAYVNGEKITGNIVRYNGTTYTPTTEDELFPAGAYNSKIIVKGDSNLVAGNIKSGVSIFGVSGSYAGSGGSSGGLVMKTGTTTSATIETGLSSIKAIVIYKNSLSATGLIQGVYITDDDTLHYAYCSQYNTYFKTCDVSKSTASSVSGGTFTLGTSGTSGLSSSTTYNWIAFGEE